jgi:hypothetical protein
MLDFESRRSASYLSLIRVYPYIDSPFTHHNSCENSVIIYLDLVRLIPYLTCCRSIDSQLTNVCFIFHDIMALQLACLAALWGSVFSASAFKLFDKKKFSLEETVVERAAPRSALHVVRSDYAKHGLEIPQELEEELGRLAPPGQTSVAAVPLPGDREYNVKVQIGNRNFTLEFDTGSSDL